MRALLRAILLVALCALVLAACGGGRHPRPASTAGPVPGSGGAATSTAHGKHPSTNGNLVYIFSSLPLSGPEGPVSHQIVDGIELALDQTTDAAHPPHIGAYPIVYRSLSDSARRRPHGWSAEQTVRNAERAARNPQTIAYIGELDSGATALSLPILNQAGIVQITPGSGYPGLTDSVSTPKGITALGEPAKYYPQQPSRHTLLRLIPNDLVQAAAAAELLDKTLGCNKLGVWEFGGGSDARSLTLAVKATASYFGMSVVPTGKLPPDADLAGYLQHLQVGCAVLTGSVTTAAVGLTRELRTGFGAKVVGTYGFCNRGWVQAFRGAVGRAVDAGLYCTTPLRPLRDYPRSSVAHFIAAFRAKYHRAPQSAASFYGYQAAQLVLDAMHGLLPGDHRDEVIEGLLGGAQSPFGYFYTNGDLQNNAYGVDSLATGLPKPYTTIDPPNVLSSPR